MTTTIRRPNREMVMSVASDRYQLFSRCGLMDGISESQYAKVLIGQEEFDHENPQFKVGTPRDSTTMNADDGFQAEFRANKAAFEAIGLTEASYIRAARLEAGIGVTIPAQSTMSTINTTQSDDAARAEFRSNQRFFEEIGLDESSCVRAAQIERGETTSAALGGKPVAVVDPYIAAFSSPGKLTVAGETHFA